MPPKKFEEPEDPEEDLAQVFEELRELRAPTLSVHVDFMQLLDQMGEEDSFVMLGKLKDLLG